MMSARSRESQPAMDDSIWTSRFKTAGRTVLQHVRKHTGVGIVCAVAYFDPGNWGVDLQAGSEYGYKLLFVVLLAGLFAVFLQVQANLASHCRLLLHDRPKHTKLWRWLALYPLYFLAEIAIIATDLAELLGSAIALCMLFPRLELWHGVLITGFDVFLILAMGDPLRGKPVRMFEFLIAALVFAVLICMGIILSKVDIDWADTFHGFVPSRTIFQSGALYISVGIVGATVMPHSLFLGSSLATQDRLDFLPSEDDKIKLTTTSTTTSYDSHVAEPLPLWRRCLQRLRDFVVGALRAPPFDPNRARPKTHADRENRPLSFVRAHLNHGVFDVVFSLLGFAVLINSMILILASAVFFYGGAGTPDQAASLFDAYDVIRDYVGTAAATLFALALLASGQSSSLIATVAGQAVSEGFLQWRVSPIVRRFLTRLLAIIPSMAVAIAVGRRGIDELLVISQVVLSIVLPFITLPLILLTSSKSVMSVKKPAPHITELYGDGQTAGSDPERRPLWPLFLRHHRVATQPSSFDLLQPILRVIMKCIFTDYAAQEAIDEQIAQHETAIQALKTRRNTHSAVSKLPIEILSLIFETVRLQDFTTAGEDPTDILGVCRHWRNIALDYPPYWSMINIDESCPLEAIRRSKSTPLRVSCNLMMSPVGNDAFWHSLQMVMNYRHQVEEFSLTLSHLHDESAEEFFDVVSLFDAPLLRYLTIEAGVLSLPTHRLSRAIPFKVVPSLHVLRLHGIHFPPDIPDLPSLRSLVMDGYHEIDDMSLSWIIKLLRKTPNVERISLDRIASANPTDVSGPLPVPLPRLRSLVVYSRSTMEAKLYEYLDFPSSIEIFAVFRLIDDESLGCYYLTNLGRLVSRLTSGSMPVSFEKITINVDHETSQFVFKLSTAGAKNPSVSFWLPMDPSSLASYARLCAAIPLDRVLEVTFESGRDPTISRAWSDLFPKLTNAKTLEIRSQEHSVLSPLLTTSRGAPCNTKLEVLYYRRMVFYEDPALEGASSMNEFLSAEIDGLMEEEVLVRVVDEDRPCPFPSTTALLRRRREMGVPIQKLIIRNCEITARQVDLLKRYVEVDWDGIVAIRR
ncbi:hypothetical protein ONZ45_g7712 [Pleurotus djamor]|nr:hypothetical protein ONZ45_g7712 [Pleurotus djamor]